MRIKEKIENLEEASMRSKWEKMAYNEFNIDQMETFMEISGKMEYDAGYDVEEADRIAYWFVKEGIWVQNMPRNRRYESRKRIGTPSEEILSMEENIISSFKLEEGDSSISKEEFSAFIKDAKMRDIRKWSKNKELAMEECKKFYEV